MRKKWNLFVKFGVLLTSLFVIFVINIKNTSATSNCVSGSTSASTGLRLHYYGGGSELVLDNWWTEYERAVSSHIQRVSFNMSTAQTGFYTITWTEMLRNPDGNSGLLSSLAGSDGITVLDVDVASVETDGNLYYSYFVTLYKNTENNVFSFAHEIKFTSPPTNWVILSPIATNYVCDNTDYNIALDSIKSSIDWNSTLTTQIKDVLIYVADEQLEDIKDILNNIEINGSSAAVVDKLDEMDDKDNQDRDNIEQQSSDAQDSADDSQSDAESTGTTLLAAFTAFVNALTNANPSNCNIDMDMGNLDLGVVNFCQLNPPPGFTTLSSIFLILFCVPLSIATARKVINLFRSFQS